MKGFFFLIWLLLWSLNALAEEGGAEWQLDSAESHITFSVAIRDSPAGGEFTKFSTRILFDPQQLAQSRLEVVIDLEHIEASYRDVAENLGNRDWFDVVRFPEARFVGRHFKYLGDKNYQVTGELTLRDVTRRETLYFTLTEYSDSRAKITGRMEIDRRDFGVGQGDWREVSFVAGTVFLNVVVAARRN